MSDDTGQKENPTMEILHPQIADTTENWNKRIVPVPENHLAIDIDKRIIKVGTGTLPFSSLKNHTHDEQYSTLTHGHYFGYGEKWFRAKPSLWLRSDLVNHPELVELNGQYIDDARATKLVDLYVSETRISPIATEMTSENYAITASSTSPLCLPYHAFGASITINNLINALDQWVTEQTGEDAEEWVAMENKGSALYTPMAYAIVARCGTPVAPFLPSPSPRDWYVEASDDGATWNIIDTVTDAPVWNTNEQRAYELKGPVKDTRFLRLRITKWHIPTDAGCIQEVGIRRIVFYGKRAGGFALPNLPPLHPDFAWVIPIDDIGVGMKHEEVGDIGYTSNTMPLLPKNRMIADGRSLSISENEQLYGCFYQKYAPPIGAASATCSSGSVDLHDDKSIVIDIPNTEESKNVPFACVITFNDEIHVGQLVSLFENTNCIGTNIAWHFAKGEEWIPLATLQDVTDAATVIDIPGTTEQASIFRFTVTKWSSDVAPITRITLGIKGSPKNTFYIPTIKVSDEQQGIPYLVTQVRTEDINSKVVLDMQNVISDLQQQLAAVIKRLGDAEAEIQTSKQG